MCYVHEIRVSAGGSQSWEKLALGELNRDNVIQDFPLCSGHDVKSFTNLGGLVKLLASFGITLDGNEIIGITEKNFKNNCSPQLWRS